MLWTLSSPVEKDVYDCQMVNLCCDFSNLCTEDSCFSVACVISSAKQGKMQYGQQKWVFKGRIGHFYCYFIGNSCTNKGIDLCVNISSNKLMDSHKCRNTLEWTLVCGGRHVHSSSWKQWPRWTFSLSHYVFLLLLLPRFHLIFCFFTPSLISWTIVRPQTVSLHSHIVSSQSI